jgi:folate-binding Fe-S cluster repair protein YgfZ
LVTKVYHNWIKIKIIYMRIVVVLGSIFIKEFLTVLSLKITPMKSSRISHGVWWTSSGEWWYQTRIYKSERGKWVIVGKLYGSPTFQWMMHKQLVSRFQIIDRFDKSRYIIFTMHLASHSLYMHSKSNKFRNSKTTNKHQCQLDNNGCNNTKWKWT